MPASYVQRNLSGSSTAAGNVLTCDLVERGGKLILRGPRDGVTTDPASLDMSVGTEGGVPAVRRTAGDGLSIAGWIAWICRGVMGSVVVGSAEGSSTCLVSEGESLTSAAPLASVVFSGRTS